MTPQEIIREIRMLPPVDRKAVKDALDNVDADELDVAPVSEEVFLEKLLAKGIISSIPDRSKLTDDDYDFEPIEVKGEPLSEMIIREKR